jgi:hypothetical protein
MLPTISFNEYTDLYTVTLWRNGIQMIHHANTVSLGNIPEDTIQPSEREKLDGPACDGVFYYIQAQRDDKDMMVWLSKDEFHFIKNRLGEVNEELSNYRRSKIEMRAYLAHKHE